MSPSLAQLRFAGSSVMMAPNRRAKKSSSVWVKNKPRSRPLAREPNTFSIVLDMVSFNVPKVLFAFPAHDMVRFAGNVNQGVS